MVSPVYASHRALDSNAHAGAFFDVDNTLVPGAAIEISFFRYLLKRGLVGVREAADSLCFLLRHIPPFSLRALRERKLYLTGKQPAAIEPLAQDFIRSEICPRLSPEGRATLEAHRRAGHAVVLLTGSLDFLIAPLAAALQVETVMAARPERTPNGYTGHVLPPFPYGEGKRRLVESFVRQHNMALKDCYAYGDSPGDVEVLQSVGYPTVVNPIRGMARIARQHGWPVARWSN
ncbi:MAG: HAD family hydrolase [Nitrospiraceae bacterium]